MPRFQRKARFVVAFIRRNALIPILLALWLLAACQNGGTAPSSPNLAATQAAELSIQAAVHATLAAKALESSPSQSELTKVTSSTPHPTQILEPTPTFISPTETPTPPQVQSTATPLPTNPPQPTMTPTLASEIGVSQTFGSLRFCKEKDFDQTTKRCITSQNLFTGKVEIVYVSWEPSPDKVGSLFKRKWYLDDDKPFLVTENENEYAYLAVSTRESLKPGSYLVELYVGDELVQTGRFIIK